MISADLQPPWWRTTHWQNLGKITATEKGHSTKRSIWIVENILYKRMFFMNSLLNAYALVYSSSKTWDAVILVAQMGPLHPFCNDF